MLARLRKAKENGESGFTLIELLVVMIIIGILAAIAIPAFLSQREKARDTSTKADVSTVGKEIAAFYVDGTGAVTVSVTGTTATITTGGDATATPPVPATTLTTVKLSKGTALNNQTANSTETTWCVALTNPNGSASNKIWHYSAADGLKAGAC